MGDGTKENPYTREDVVRLIAENGGTAKGLDLSGKVFEEGIDLRELDLSDIILKGATLVSAHLEEIYLKGAHLEEATLWDAHLERAHMQFAHLKKADLTGAHLEEAYLQDVHLEEAALQGAHLEKADLSRAHLEEAALQGAHLEGAKLIFTSLERAQLEIAHLEGARLMVANLERAKLMYAHLEGAIFINARLEEADLSFARLENADLTAAHLEKARLWGTRLEKTDLIGANLEEADLLGAHLEGADLSRADLRRANLKHAHLQEATLWDAHLEGAYLLVAKLSPDTKLEKADWGNYILGEEREKQFHLAIVVYRQLKMWYTQAGYADIAAKFYYREKEANRKALKLFSKSWNHRLALQASYLVFGHGEGWKRLLFGTMPCLISIFALIYFISGSVWKWWAFWNSLYFSAVSFTALGYGNWLGITNDWIRGIGAFESFVGVFMMALLLVTFIRKWTR